MATLSKRNKAANGAAKPQPMSLKSNIAANYLSQVYVAAIGLVATPWYLARLGPEAYGLVGFFGVLLAWFQLLDVGLSPVVMREVSRFRAHVLPAEGLWERVRAIEGIFAALAITASILLVLNSRTIAGRWLVIQTLDPDAVVLALRVMGLSVGLRFISVFYRGIITGLEQLVWLAGFNSIIASLRAFSVVPAMMLFGNEPVIFFATQALIGLLEVGVLVLRAYGQLPKINRVKWRLAPLHGIWRFSAAIAFTGGIGVVITQSDRLILSGMLDLHAYGNFTLATLAASSILLIGSPLGSALQPRLTTLAAYPEQKAAFDLYHQAGLMLSVLTVPLATLLAVFAEPVIWAWTGNPEEAAMGAPVLGLYAAGNAIAAQLVLPYSLQFAFGRLRLHVIGNALLIALLIPAQILLTRQFGAIGAGACWLVLNILYAMIWIPVALKRLAPQVLRDWYLNFLKTTAVSICVALLAKPLITLAYQSGRAYTFIALISLGLALTAGLVLLHAPLRKQLNMLISARTKVATP